MWQYWILDLHLSVFKIKQLCLSIKHVRIVLMLNDPMANYFIWQRKSFADTLNSKLHSCIAIMELLFKYN
jgi:hypothetical protein